MLENLVIVAGQVAVLFLLMAVGFLLGRLKWLDGNSTAQLSRILLYIILPCVVVRSLQVPFSLSLLADLGTGCLLVLLHTSLLIAVCHMTFRRTDPVVQAPLRFAQVYSNNLFMGLPLLMAVLGDSVAVYVVPSLLVVQLFMWTHGSALMGGKMSPAKMFLNPGVIGVLVGALFFLAGVSLPGPVYTALGHIGNMNTPLSMMIVGYQMSQTDLKTTFINSKLYGTALIRLILAPALAFAVMAPIRLSRPEMYASLVILSGAPAASITSSFSIQHGKDANTGAQITSLSTLFSLMTLPVCAVLAQP